MDEAILFHKLIFISCLVDNFRERILAILVTGSGDLFVLENSLEDVLFVSFSVVCSLLEFFEASVRGVLELRVGILVT